MNSSKRSMRSSTAIKQSQSFRSPKVNSVDNVSFRSDNDGRNTFSISSDPKRTISNDKMLKFIHHAEQQVHQYQKKANETEYEQCFIQPVKDSTPHMMDTGPTPYPGLSALHSKSSSSLLHSSIMQNDNSMKHTYLNQNFRSRSQAFSVENYVPSPRHSTPVTPSFRTRTPMFSKSKKKLVKSQHFVNDDMSDDSLADRPRRKGKKKRFSIPFFSKKKDHKTRSESTPSDKEDSTSSSSEPEEPVSHHTSYYTPKSKMNPNSHQKKESEDLLISERDIRQLRDDVIQQRKEIEQLNEMYHYIHSSYSESVESHKEIISHFSYLQKEHHKELEDMKNTLLSKKEEEEKRLMGVLLNHFRSIIESKVKDVQLKINSCNNRKKNVLESNITPYQNFYSRILAYCVAGITVVGSVIIYLLLFIQACFGFSQSSLTN